MIRLDLNNPEFQANLLKLEKQQALAVLQTLRMLQAMTWSQIQQSKGLRWELIQSRQGPKGEGSTRIGSAGLPCGGLAR